MFFRFMVKQFQYTCLRIGENVSIEHNVPLEQVIKDAIKKPFEIVTAFDLLKNNNDYKTITVGIV